MRILFYLHQFPAIGGIETVTACLAIGFVGQGHIVKIVSFQHNSGSRLLEMLSSNVSWVELPLNKLSSPDNEKALAEIIDDFRPDVVMFQDAYSNIQGTLRGALLLSNEDPAIIVVEHNRPMILRPTSIKVRSLKSLIQRLFYLYFKFKRNRIERMRRLELLALADSYVMLSKCFFPLHLGVVRGVGREKLDAIPNPLTLSSSKAGGGIRGKHILYMGTLCERKGVDRLIRIWSKVTMHHPEWDFWVVGDGEERDALQDLVSRKKLHNVIFLGAQSDVDRFYRESRILVMASDFEGWGLVLVEAMSRGCVPISFDSFESLFDIIDSGINGMIVKSFSEVAFATALSDLMQDEGRWARMSERAVAKSNQFEIGNILSMWNVVLDRTVKKRHSASAKRGGV